MSGRRVMVYEGEQWRRRPEMLPQVLVNVIGVRPEQGCGPMVEFRVVGAMGHALKLMLASFLDVYQPASEAAGPQVTPAERWPGNEEMPRG